MSFRRTTRNRPDESSAEGRPVLPPGEMAATELIERCLNHADGAWEEFLRRYGRLIHATIHKVGLPADDQEEAFQITVIAIYRQLGRLRDRDRLVSWIVGIAWRQSIDRIRRRGRETRMEELDDAVLQHSMAPIEPVDLPDETRLSLERAHHAREAVEALSERCRRLLGLFFFEDPPPDYAEIARREGIPIGSLGPTRARCLERLRRYFEERGWV